VFAHQSCHRDAEAGNCRLWDEIAPVHLRSYKEVSLLREGKEILDDVELREVGNVHGKKLLHLQGLPARFVHANVYDSRSVIDEKFDLVYTSKGVLCWLRDLEEWGRIIAHFLKPGGTFYLMESHPILNALDEKAAGSLAFVHRYFHRDEPTLWDDKLPDYSDPTYIPQNASYEWDWTVSDIVNALLGAGLHIDLLNEHNRIFFRRFPTMESDDGRWFRLPDRRDAIPLLLTIRARKPG
jgi:SAM-dependent methyltransferase